MEGKRRCVRRLGSSRSLSAFFRLFHSACGTHSAIGATARFQTGVVSDSFSVSDAINLAFPFRCFRS
jgi:hypothetical protein